MGSTARQAPIKRNHQRTCASCNEKDGCQKAGHAAISLVGLLRQSLHRCTLLFKWTEDGRINWRALTNELQHETSTGNYQKGNTHIYQSSAVLSHWSTARVKDGQTMSPAWNKALSVWHVGRRANISKISQCKRANHEIWTADSISCKV